ncbi:MAG: hypothetical protein N3J91_12500 [Verrucomicrobiae bacterium]|nr:hypothetical protein [Verrucomicrobiae bacterium]
MHRNLALLGALAAGWAISLAAAPDVASAGETEAALVAARARLAELRRVCKEAHPAVQAELRRIQDLERQRRTPATPQAELALARERLAELRRTCKEQHPAVQIQLKLIAELERKAGEKPAAP